MDQLPAAPSRSGRSRPLDESEAARVKRQKAAERQRRKRKRDREGGASSSPSAMAMFNGNAAGPSPQLSQDAAQSSTSVATVGAFAEETLSPQEAIRRERMRASARERQRKHRLVVKARKLREVGLMEVTPDMRPISDSYHQAFGSMLPEMNPFSSGLSNSLSALGMSEPLFPATGQALGGQTFASTLLLSFSCAPLLKQHLLRTLHMTNEELASLEPVIAEAWDNWNTNRQVAYVETAANVGLPVDISKLFPPRSSDPSDSSNEFRARFVRSMIGPSPFAPRAEQPANSTESDPLTTTQPEAAVDPHLNDTPTASSTTEE